MKNLMVQQFMGSSITTGTMISDDINANNITIGSLGSIQCNGDFICIGKFIDDTISISSTTESYNPHTGSFLVPRGAGIGGNINTAKNISAVNIHISGNKTIKNSLVLILKYFVIVLLMGINFFKVIRNTT